MPHTYNLTRTAKKSPKVRPASRFVIVPPGRRGEWGELLLTGPLSSADKVGHWIALTTEDEEPHNFTWVELRLLPVHYRVMAGVPTARRPPPVPLVRAEHINYICLDGGPWALAPAGLVDPTADAGPLGAARMPVGAAGAVAGWPHAATSSGAVPPGLGGLGFQGADSDLSTSSLAQQVLALRGALEDMKLDKDGEGRGNKATKKNKSSSRHQKPSCRRSR